MEYNIEIQDSKGNKYYPKTKTTDVYDNNGENIEQVISQLQQDTGSSGEVVEKISQNIGTSSDTASETSSTLWGRIKYFTNLFSNIWTSARAAKLDKLDATISTRATQTSVDTIKTNVDDIKTKVTTINTNVSKVDLSQLMTKINALSTKVEEVKTLALVPKMPKLKIELIQVTEDELFTYKKFSINGCGRLITLRGNINNDTVSKGVGYTLTVDGYKYYKEGSNGDSISSTGLYLYDGTYMNASRTNINVNSAPFPGMPLNMPFTKSLEINIWVTKADSIKVIYEIYE